ncbi:MAG: tRNA lysidine(34) synthetase TilS [Firmicutes bacterium HGW-Firmicutes-15]|nr:MAG: tRNA lysidine(34) synthetase TilS [Firmicutes bacterium HGW-Firmicutes-15]
MLNKKLEKYIEANNLIGPGELVIVGVSGGPDSMALLHLLKELAPSMQFEVLAAHLNHGLRAEAEAEELFVKEKCKAWGIDCYSRSVSIADLARVQKTTLEDTGRNARYQYFNELRELTGAQLIATAHHYDDVAETVLLHLLRGSGIKGLRGILPRSGNLIRPLIMASKEELLNYLEARGIDYCLDQSNDDSVYLRNRIRHGLIPYMQKEFNPRIVGKLNQLALIARDENEALEEESRNLWAGVLLKEEEESLVLDNQAMRLLPRAYQRRIVMRAFAKLTSESEWNLEDVQKVLELSDKKGSSLTLQLKKKVRVNKSYDRMIFTTQSMESIGFLYEVPVPGKIEITETGEIYKFTLVKREDYCPESEDIYLDYEMLPETIYLRSRRAGDIFRPQGMTGSKKLKKYFIDLKVPYYERDRVALLAAEDREIFAVLGMGISRMAAMSTNTRTVLLIKKSRAGENRGSDDTCDLYME